MMKKVNLRPFISFLLLLFTISCKSAVKLSKEYEERTSSRVKKTQPAEQEKREYLSHKKIKTTYFYIGQEDVTKSGVLDNGSSAWMSKWVQMYGGVDHPVQRHGYLPKDFTPKENPFYCALPFNDVNTNGHKENVLEVIPWAQEFRIRQKDGFFSYCKNRWVKITYKERVCYAQWEDVGPFETDDWEYVFGTQRPKNNKNGGVGLDISPACFQYLGMQDNDYTDWQFVDFIDVPDGPWLDYITISDPRWD